MNAYIFVFLILKSILIYCAYYLPEEHNNTTLQYLLRTSWHSDNKYCEESSPIKWNCSGYGFRQGLNLFQISHVIPEEKEEQFKIVMIQMQNKVTEICNNYRTTNRNASSYFVFDLYFKENQGNKTQATCSSILQLFVYYSVFLLTHKKFQEFQDLITEIEKRKARIVLDNDSYTSFWRTLEIFLQKNEISYDILCCILIMIGELPNSNINPIKLQSNSPSTIARFITNGLNLGVLNFLLSQNRADIIKLGIVTCLPLAMLQGSDWKELFLSIDIVTRGKLITRIIEVLQTNKIKSQETITSFLADFIYEQEKISTQKESLKYLCKLTNSFKEFLKIFKILYNVDKNESKWGWGAESVNPEVNNFCLRNNLDFKMILEMITYLEQEDENIKALCYEPYLRTKIACMLDNKEYIIEENFGYISQIFEKKITYLRKNLDIHQFITDLLTKKGFSFISIFRGFFKSRFESSKIYLKLYVENKIDRKNIECIIEIEKEFSKLDRIAQERLINESLIIIKEYLERRYQDFLKSACIFDQCNSKFVKDRFIDMIFDMIIHQYKSKPYLVDSKLTDLVDSYYNTKRGYVFYELQKKISTLLDPEEFLKNKETERVNFLRNPTTESGLFIILTHNYNQKMQKCLVEFFTEIIDDLYGKKFTTDEIVYISHHVNEKKSAFLSCLRETMKISNKPIDIESCMDEIFREFTEFRHKKEKIAVYINMFIEHRATDSEPILKALSDFDKGFGKRKQSEFIFPPLLQKFESIACNISGLFYSQIFQTFYVKIKSIDNNPSDQIIQLTHAAFEELQQELQTFFSDIGAFPLSRFIDITKELQERNLELNILQSSFNLSESQILEASELMNFIFKDLDLERFCKSLLDMQKYTKFRDTAELDQCQEYLKICIDEKATILCKRYLDCSKATFKQLTHIYSKDQIIWVIEFINVLNETTELIQFCLDLKREDLDYLRESVHDFENIFVTAQEIIDFHEVWNYTNQLCRIGNYYELLHAIMQIEQEKMKKLIKQIKVANNQINAIKRLHMELNLKGAAKKQQIIDIYIASKLHFISRAKHLMLNLVMRSINQKPRRS